MAVLCGMPQYSIWLEVVRCLCIQRCTMHSVACLQLSDVSAMCRVTYFQFPIRSAFIPCRSASRTTAYWFITQYRTTDVAENLGRYLSCARRTKQGNDFELILTPHYHLEGITMSHAKFGPNLLKTMACIRNKETHTFDYMHYTCVLIIIDKMWHVHRIDAISEMNCYTVIIQKYAYWHVSIEYILKIWMQFRLTASEYLPIHFLQRIN